MIKARHKPFFVQFFRFYTRMALKLKFKDVKLVGTYKTKELPVLIIANHFSWWDGFFVYYLNDKIFKKKYHVMMLEEQLKDRLFLNKAGAFSIRKNHRSFLESLNYANELLKEKDNLVLFFPQGVFQSIYRQPLDFERGVERILHRGNNINVIFAANLIEYFSASKPGVTMYFKEWVPGDKLHGKMLEEAYNAFYADCVFQQKEV